MSTNGKLSALAFDPELTPGARNAVTVCLRIQPSEKVTVITDDACQPRSQAQACAPRYGRSQIK